jgi:hypothetical protein
MPSNKLKGTLGGGGVCGRRVQNMREKNHDVSGQKASIGYKSVG